MSSEDPALQIYAFHFSKLKIFPIFYVSNFKSEKNERGEKGGQKQEKILRRISSKERQITLCVIFFASCFSCLICVQEIAMTGWISQ